MSTTTTATSATTTSLTATSLTATSLTATSLMTTSLTTTSTTTTSLKATSATSASVTTPGFTATNATTTTPPICAAALADAADVALFLLDRGGRPVLVNRLMRSLCRATNGSRVSLLSILRVLSPGRRDRRLALPALRDALAGAVAPVRIEAAAAGSETGHLVSIAPCHAADGTLSGALIAATEIGPLGAVSARLERFADGLARAVEDRTRALERSERKYRELFDASPDGYITLAPSGRVDEVNRTALCLIGALRAEVVGRRALRFVPRSIRPGLRPVIGAFLRHGIVANVEVAIPRRDGRELILMVNALAAGTPPAGARIVLRDVTRRIALERQIVALDRLAATGQLAAGVAHEINNPLQAVLAHLDVLINALPPGFAERNSADRVHEGVRRIQQIVRDLLDLHRGSEQDLGAVDVNQIVQEAVGLIRVPLRHRGLSLGLELAPAAPFVRGNARHVYQVVLNLLLNAMQATPHGGVVVARTRHAPGADRVEIEIADTGPGVPEDHLAHIFDPFHAHGGGHGTGLGLFVTHGLVQQHGGTILVDSRPGCGSTFRVLLPVQQVPPP